VTRQPLTIADLATLAGVAAADPAPDAVFRTAEALAQRAIGHRLFTVMRLHGGKRRGRSTAAGSGEAVAMVERNPIASEITAVLLSSYSAAQKGNCRAPGGIRPM
jgi:hypothetical protein